jgi:hypothetical protein
MLFLEMVYVKFIYKVLATAAMLFICVAVLRSMQVEYLVTILDVLNHLSQLKLTVFSKNVRIKCCT